MSVKYRDAVTGEYVTEEYALDNPDTTVAETESDDDEPAKPRRASTAKVEQPPPERTASRYDGWPNDRFSN